MKRKKIFFILLLLNIDYNFICANQQTSDVSISYVILSHNETNSLRTLINYLSKSKSRNDEIIVIDDFSDNPFTLNILNNAKKSKKIRLFKHQLNYNFANQRNFGLRKARNNYIFFVDSDEIPSRFLMKNLKNIIKENDFEAFALPRLHLVENMPENDNRIDEKGYICWPDFQIRIIKKIPKIRWKNNVHEVIVGFDSLKFLPQEEKYSLIEKKRYSKWENSHKFYLKCFENWLKQAIKEKNKELIKHIINCSPKEHLVFLLNEDFNDLVNKKAKHKTKKILESNNITSNEIEKIIHSILE